MLRFSGVGLTDVGHVREHNEDSAFVGPYLALVADGVGGAAAGEVASATAAYVVSSAAEARFGAPPEQVLADAVETTRATLRAGAEEDLDRVGMATTLTAVATDGSRFVLAHVGDSRCYLFRDGGLNRISTDHTFVQQMIDQGHLEPEEVPLHPWRNVVLRSLHGDPARRGDRTDLIELDLRTGDRLLLCSDGLTDMVPEPSIAEALELDDPAAAAAVLLQGALAAGGNDNVTCLVLDVVDGPATTAGGDLLGAVRDLANVVHHAKPAASA